MEWNLLGAYAIVDLHADERPLDWAEDENDPEWAPTIGFNAIAEYLRKIEAPMKGLFQIMPSSPPPPLKFKHYKTDSYHYKGYAPGGLVSQHQSHFHVAPIGGGPVVDLTKFYSAYGIGPTSWYETLPDWGKKQVDEAEGRVSLWRARPKLLKLKIRMQRALDAKRNRSYPTSKHSTKLKRT